MSNSVVMSVCMVVFLLEKVPINNSSVFEKLILYLFTLLPQ
jgi:hypothetical protein